MNIQHDLSEFEQLPPITLRAGGDLLLNGWERKAIEATTDEDDPHVTIDETQIRVESGGNLRIQIPMGAYVTLDAGGDVHIQQSQGPVQLGAVGGDLHAQAAQTIEFKKIGGDLRVVRTGAVAGHAVGGDAHVEDVPSIDLKEVGGDLSVRRADTVSCGKVGGDSKIYEVKQAVAVSTGGDLEVMACSGDIAGNASGDVQVEVLASTPQIRINAKSDIRCIAREAVNAKVRVVCGSGLTIVGSGGSQSAQGRGVHTFDINQGEGSISLVAGSDVNVTAAGAIGELRSVSADVGGIHSEMENLNVEMQRLGKEMEGLGIELGREFGSLGERIAETINRKLRRKLEKDLHKAKAKAGRRGVSFGFDFPNPPTPPSPPRPPRPLRSAFVEEVANEPVSDEERMLVLRMLEEGKITADEAEKLIAALEGEHSEG